MKRKLNIIENCFIRENKKCGRVLNGSKMAFIATPAADYVQLELEIIKSKLKSFEIEPYVAVENRAFGKDVFCEKICGKIIEALFCIVLLNDKAENIGDKSVLVSNPNVYYEYGLMTSLNKKIIPLQKKNQKLAFNIQSLDTIKYSESNFVFEIENAIKSIFIENEQTEEKRPGVLPKELSIYLGLNGIVWPQITQGSDFETALLVGSELGFFVLADFVNYQVCYLKVLQNDDEEKEVHIYIKAVQKRLEALMNNIFRHIDLAECVEYTEDNKRIVNKEISSNPEIKKQVKVLQSNLRMFGYPKIYIYRESFRDKKYISQSVGKLEYKLLKPKLVLLDKAEILSFIESNAK